MYKKCRMCFEIKEAFEFNINRSSGDGLTSRCKMCHNTYQKKKRSERDPSMINECNIYLREWRKSNKEKVKQFEQSPCRKEYRKNWREDNKEKISNQSREYFLENKERLREIDRVQRRVRYNKKMKDPLFVMKESVRSMIRRSFVNKGVKKIIASESILGCSYSDFKKYIESKFEHWMNFDNYGKYNGCLNFGWDIDHIIPISSAKTEEDILKLSHYTNLQPLCSKINRDIKKDKLDV